MRSRNLFISGALAPMIALVIFLTLLDFRSDGGFKASGFTIAFYLVFLSICIVIFTVSTFVFFLTLYERTAFTNTIVRRYFIKDVFVLDQIEKVLKAHRTEYLLLGPRGRLPDRFLPRPLRFMHEKILIPSNDTRIIVGRSRGPPDELYTEIYFGPKVQVRTNSLSGVISEIDALLGSLERRPSGVRG